MRQGDEVEDGLPQNKDEARMLIDICNKLESKATPAGKQLLKSILVKLGSADSINCAALDASDVANFANYIAKLMPASLFAIGGIRPFGIRWLQECKKHEEDHPEPIAVYANDPTTFSLLRTTDDLVVDRLQHLAKSGSGSRVLLSNSAVVILLARISKFVDGDIILRSENDKLPELSPAILYKLLDIKEGAFFTFEHIRVLSTICRLTETPFRLRQTKTTTDVAHLGVERYPSTFWRNLLNLEIQTNYWFEVTANAAHVEISEGAGGGAGSYSFANGLDCKNLLGGFGFIPKADLLRAFHQNIPTLLFLAKSLPVSDDYSTCRETIIELEETAKCWDVWAEEAFECLEIPSDFAKLDVVGKTKCLTAAILNQKGDLARKNKSLQNQLDDVRGKNSKIESLQDQARGRETLIASQRKKNDELRSQLRTKETEVKDLGKHVQDKEAQLEKLKKETDPRNAAELEKSMKDRERRVKEQEEALRTQQEEFRGRQRKSQKGTHKESKTAEAQLTKQLREEQQKVLELEKKLNSSCQAYTILQLDYDAMAAELHSIKEDRGTELSREEKQAELRTLQEDLDRYKGLYETSRLNEEIVQRRIDKAVRESHAKKDAEFKEWKVAVSRIIKGKDEKLLASQKETEAEISGILKSKDERIGELSRAKVSLQKESAAKDDEISAKNAELMSKDEKISRLKDAMKAIHSLSR